MRTHILSHALADGWMSNASDAPHLAQSPPLRYSITRYRLSGDWKLEGAGVGMDQIGIK